MNSRHLVDPELAPALDLVPPVDIGPDNLAELRKSAQPVPVEAPTDVRLEVQTITGPAGDPLRLLVFTPPRAQDEVLPALLHIHGGGYVGGTADLNAGYLRSRSAAVGCVIVSVDYRVAPETPYPGSVEDCYTGLQWLYQLAPELGVDRQRVGVAGESAGGGLAAALALLARDRGEVPLCHQHLIFPMLDDRTCVREPHPYAGEFIWTARSNHFGWSSLLGCPPGSEGVSAYAAPARAENLAGLPPTFIAVGALDLFIEEDIEYARRLIRAGIPTELHVYPGAYHGYQVVPHAGITLNAERDSIDALRRALA